MLLLPLHPGPLLVLVALLLPTPTTAQAMTVVTLLDLGGYRPFQASVVAVDAAAGATTYALACPPSNPSACGFGRADRVPALTAVAGPLTAVEVASAAPTSFSTLACALTAASQSADVTCTRVGRDGGDPVTHIDGLAGVSYVPVTVTAGVEKLAPAWVTPTGGSPSSSTGPPAPKTTPNGAVVGRGSASMVAACMAALLTVLAAV